MQGTSTPPFPVGLSPLRANLQALALLAVVYGFIYGNAWLGGNTVPQAPIKGTLAIGVLMLLVTALLLRKDADWKSSLGVHRPDLPRTLGFGLLGVAMGYAANVVIVVPYLVASGNLMQKAADKAQWTAKLGELPFAVLLPLAMFVGLWEELVFRGFLLGRLRAALDSGAGSPRSRTILAVAFTGVLFGAAHGYQGAVGILQTTTLGVVLGGLTVWRKSVWPAVVAHLTIDAASLFALKVAKPMLEELVKKSAG